jgi:hypothetical protein
MTESDQRISHHGLLKSIPQTDLFSFTAQGKTFILGNWLAEITCYLIYRFGGLPLLILGNSILLEIMGRALVFTVTHTNPKGVVQVAPELRLGVPVQVLRRRDRCV